MRVRILASFVWVSLRGAQLGGCATAGAKAPAGYLLAGQSNMSGRGLLKDLTAEEQLPDPAVRLYGNDGMVRIAVEPLDSAKGQIDKVSTDTLAGVGPGLFFARAILRTRGGAVLLVPCAKGGSSIRQWAPAEGRDSLYGSCVARAREAGAPVRGILWYQGETDAETIDAAGRWKADFRRTMTQLRSDLGNGDIPIVLVQLADDPPGTRNIGRFPAWSIIQDAQAEDLLSCTAMVSAKGLPLKEDGLHLDTAAQRVLGARLAVAMNELLERGCGR